jgi:tagatose 1,6-diphosphate aldolase
MTATVAAHPLAPFLTSAGTICALALDHRDALRNALRRVGRPPLDEPAAVALKARIAAALGPAASALLLDAPAVATCRGGGAGILVALEAQAQDRRAGGRLTRLLDDFGPRQAAALGADGCKLLLHYRPDHAATAPVQLALAERVADECHRAGLPLVVEPLVYPLDGEPGGALAAVFGELVAEAAAALATSGADLLKLQFPGSPQACERVTRAAAPLPWTLLGGARTGRAEFAVQLRSACAAGASGFLAGRAIWGHVLLADDPDAQTVWLRHTARPALDELVAIADTEGRRIR